MEISTLLTQDIYIEDERWDLQNKGLSWHQIEAQLNSKYRESSIKRLFRCKCCNSTTFLVLNENKACFFKHESKDECAGDRNYTTYISATNRNEHPKHRVGRAIIKDQLMNNLTRHGAVIKEGYFSKRELKFVPDFIVEWPDDETWTIDYVTGTRSDQYQCYLKNKQKAYVENESVK